MDLRIFPDSVLAKKCEDVEIGGPNAKAILDEMAEKMYEWHGAGLAAPQVGISKKFVVIDVRDNPSTLYKMINPKIVWASEDELVESEEGCLSLPELRETVIRFARVKVEYLDENFNPQVLDADDFLACCVQHELDHLDGKLYIDRLSRLKRNLAVKKFKKLQEEQEFEGE